MHEPTWIRWYMVVFFTLFGISLLRGRERFGSAGSFFCSICLDGPMQDRLVSVYESREQREALPSAWMGGSLGALSLIMALLSALTQISVAILYAANVVALVSVLTFAYIRLRTLALRRIATLHVRHPSEIAPWYAWTLVPIATVSPLLWLPNSPGAALLIVAAGIATLGLARCVAEMPALLNGEDIVVETFVDTRLRAVRAVNLLASAIAPGFVFEAFTNWSDSIAHVGALTFGLLTLVLLVSLQVRLVRRRPSRTEIQRWVNATP